MKTPEGAPILWTPQQTADYLHTTPNSLRQMRVKGSGPKYLKSGARVLYRAQDVLDYLVEGGGAA